MGSPLVPRGWPLRWWQLVSSTSRGLGRQLLAAAGDAAPAPEGWWRPKRRGAAACGWCGGLWLLVTRCQLFLFCSGTLRPGVMILRALLRIAWPQGDEDRGGRLRAARLGPLAAAHRHPQASGSSGGRLARLLAVLVGVSLSRALLQALPASWEAGHSAPRHRAARAFRTCRRGYSWAHLLAALGIFFTLDNVCVSTVQRLAGLVPLRLVAPRSRPLNPPSYPAR